MVSWLVKWCLARAGEPSTWKGLVALATAFGVTISLEMAEAIIALGLAIGGIINVVTPDPATTSRNPDSVHADDGDIDERLHDDPVPTPDSRPSVRLDTQRNAFKDLDRFSG